MADWRRGKNFEVVQLYKGTIMKKIQQGFTLIELMIVIAIIAILAAIALPAYQDYIVRSKVSEAVLAADGCKTSVAEFFQSQGTFPPSLATSGCSSHGTQYVSSLNVVAGVIQVSLSTDPSLSGAAGSLFALSPTSTSLDAPLTWDCTANAGTTIPPKFLPAKCR